TVTFEDAGTPLAGGLVPISSSGTTGTATFMTSSLAAAAVHPVTAVYNSDPNYALSTSNTISQTVKQNTTATVSSTSDNPSVYGESVSFTATVTGSTAIPAGGTVTFLDGGSTL